MARYEHLPFYKRAMDLAVHFERVVVGFSRYHKYTLGSELRNTSRALVGLIIQANAERDKRPALLAVRAKLDELLATTPGSLLLPITSGCLECLQTACICR